MSALLLLLTVALAAPEAPAESTWARAKASRADAPVLPDEERRLALQELLVDLLRGAPAGSLPRDATTRAEALGLSLERQGDRLWLVEPRGHDGRGDGLVAIRLGPLPAELVLQAPHPFYDENTGAITGALFDDGQVRAAAVASTQRYAARGIDPARQVDAPLQALTEAVALALPDPLVVQLHGFGQGTTTATAVLSDGRARSGGDTWARAMQDLARALEAEPLAGPDDVPELAARLNVQGLLLAERVRFLHVELDPESRRRLRGEEAYRARLHAALLALAARREAP